MSATIKYKGETIATASNNTKTLLTAGKYMEANVVITDNGGGGSPTLQTKSVTYTPSASQQTDTITPDVGYDGLDEVDVTVNAVSAGSATTPATTITANPTISISGNSVSASVSKTQSITPTVSAGYVSSGTAGTVTVSGSGSATIPNASVEISVPSVNNDGSVNVELGVTSGGYIASGVYNLTTDDYLPVQGAQTIYPSASDQSIASGKYLTGAQTIKGVTYSGLVAGNIKKDVVVKIGDSADDDRIVSVTGTYEGGGGGGVTWGEIGSTSVTPSVRNLYAKLADSSIEFGSFTLASTPANAFVDLFTLTSITAPCKGIVIIDDAFYQGASGLPNSGNSEAVSYAHFSKAFLNPAKETALASADPCYGYTIWTVSQTVTAAAAGGVIGANPFNGTTIIQRGYFQWNGQTLQWKSQYGGQQYTTFVAGRTYRWIAY